MPFHSRGPVDPDSRALPRPISDPVRDGENPSGRDRYEPAAEDGPEDVPSRALSDRERQKEWIELGHIWLLNFALGAELSYPVRILWVRSYSSK